MSGKERAFFVTPNNVDSIKKIFYVKDSEEIINAVSEESVRQMINSLKNSGGKKIFFILVNYPLLRQILMQFGFVEGKDFLNAELFLSDAHGVPLDSHQFVKLM